MAAIAQCEHLVQIGKSSLPVHCSRFANSEQDCIGVHPSRPADPGFKYHNCKQRLRGQPLPIECRVRILASWRRSDGLIEDGPI